MKHIKYILLVFVVLTLVIEVVPYAASYLLQRRYAYDIKVYYEERVGVELSTDTVAVGDAFSDNGYLVPVDYRSDLVNTKDSIRNTVGGPLSAPALYMYGNSALYGYYVDDANTIPSQLQLLDQNYRVVNLAYKMHDITTQLARLKDTKIQSGDIVVFYDGATDTLNEFSAPKVCSVQVGIVQFVCQWIPKYFNSTYANAKTADNKQALIDAKKYTEDHGGRFFHFWQPVIFSHALTMKEDMLIHSHDGAVVPNWVDNSEWSVAPPNNTISLFHILDNTPNSYIDYIHTSPTGNKVVARAIYSALTGAAE